MLNKLIPFFLLLILISSCGVFKKKSVEGQAPAIKQKDLVQRMEAAQNQFETLRLVGNAKYNKGGTSQSFKLEIRIQHDKLVWVDIADPILGIKIARAVVYPDSVAFINRLEKEYLTGKTQDLQKQVGISFGFNELQSILSANLLFELSKQFELYYKDASYLLSDFDPTPLTDANQANRNLSQTVFKQIWVEPSSAKPSLQTMKEPALGKIYSVAYQNLTSENGLVFPKSFEIEYLDGGENLTFTYDIKRVETNTVNLNFPFNIPSDYDKLP